jgi:anion transporter
VVYGLAWHRPTGVAFSTSLALTGFQSPATWLVIVGILIGEAARQSGLADLVERLALYRMPVSVATDAVAAYRYLLVVLSFGSLALAVLIPSSLVRVLILAPILQSLGELFEERRAAVGIFLGPLFATFYGSSGILTGSLANIIVTGLVESSGGPAITWTEWTLWLGPVMGIGRVVLIVGIAYLLYRPRNRDGVTTPELAASVSTTARERRMLGFLLLGVVIWATDFVHGLHPLFGAVVVTLLAFAPRIGVVGPEAVGDADFSILFFLGAIFAIAEGLQQTAFTDLAANRLLSTLPADPSLPLVLVVVVVALALTLVMEGLAVASVLTPVLVSFATSAGIPLVPDRVDENGECLLARDLTPARARTDRDLYSAVLGRDYRSSKCSSIKSLLTTVPVSVRGSGSVVTAYSRGRLKSASVSVSRSSAERSPSETTTAVTTCPH